jgi:hypothetical protein
MKNIRCSFDYDSGEFAIIDDIEKMTTILTEDVINDFGGIIGKPNSNDAINFYNEYIDIAKKNKIKTDDNKNYFKSHILTSDLKK